MAIETRKVGHEEIEWDPEMGGAVLHPIDQPAKSENSEEPNPETNDEVVSEESSTR